MLFSETSHLKAPGRGGHRSVFPAFCPRCKWYFILAKYLCVTSPGFKGFIDSPLRLSKFIKPECLSLQCRESKMQVWVRGEGCNSLSRRRRQSPLRLPAIITRPSNRNRPSECMHNANIRLIVIPIHVLITFDAPSSPQTAIRALIS